MKRKASHQLPRSTRNFRGPSVSAPRRSVGVDSQNASTAAAPDPDENLETATSIVVIDSEGDFQLDFDKDGERLGLLVCRRTICRASSVFKAMLGKNSRFLESMNRNRVTNGDGVQVIRLPDDDFDTMRILMNVVHCEGNSVPDSLEFEQLDGIAILCDKYDLRRSVRVWARLWMGPHDELVGIDGYERWLCIASVFERDDLYPRITEHLISTTTTSISGELLDHARHEFTLGVPESAIERITKAREAVVSAIFKICWGIMSRLYSGDFCRHRTTREPFSAEVATRCEALNLGCLSQVFPGLDADGKTFATQKDGITIHQMSIDMITAPLYDMTKPQDSNRHVCSHRCDVFGQVRNKVEAELHNIEGLSLEDR